MGWRSVVRPSVGYGPPNTEPPDTAGAPRPSGGTGRRSGLKILWGTSPCGFESRLGYLNSCTVSQGVALLGKTRGFTFTLRCSATLCGPSPQSSPGPLVAARARPRRSGPGRGPGGLCSKLAPRHTVPPPSHSDAVVQGCVRQHCRISSPQPGGAAPSASEGGDFRPEMEPYLLRCRCRRVNDTLTPRTAFSDWWLLGSRVRRVTAYPKTSSPHPACGESGRG